MTFKMEITSKTGSIQFGNLIFFWVNQNYDESGCFGIEYSPVDDMDGYILLIVGDSVFSKNTILSYDFYAFGNYYSHTGR